MAKDMTLTEMRFGLDNLSCGSCVARAEKALATAPGVQQARVNLATKRAAITIDADFELPLLTDVMQKAGYPLHVDTPKDATVEDEQSHLRRNLILAALLTLPVFVLEMGGHLFVPFHHWVIATIGQGPSWILQFVLTSVVLFGPGAVFFRLGVPALLRGAPEMNSLVVLGTSAAWGYSTVATFAPSLLPEASRHVYFEAAAVIVTLILLGRYLEAGARGRAGAAIRGLMDLTPETATLIRDGRDITIAVGDIAPDDLIRLYPGERVAVDGIVTEGASHIDEAMISGEPIPVEKRQGATVVGGTINGTGALIYRATHVGRDTVLAKIVEMVDTAQSTRLPIQSLINKITGVFVPVVLAIATFATAGWWIIGGDPAQALVIGVSVLIIACPCAMGLATPVSIMVGTGRAAELGVLFRRGEALQRFADVDVVAFDKTGTLTEGKPTVRAVISYGTQSVDQILALAASAERQSEHPLAQAVVQHAQTRGLTLPVLTEFQSLTGSGVMAQLGDGQLLLGSDRLMVERGLSLPDQDVTSDATTIYLALDGLVIGRIDLTDALKPHAASTVIHLKARGIEVLLLSGDAAGPVAAVAAELGINDARARLRPEDKLMVVEQLRASGRVVAFVGDGINDAPVLAAADVGIALGSGTDIAIEAADVVLMSGDPAAVTTARALSAATMRNIKQNLAWAFGYNIALIPVAAGALALFGGPLLSPMLAAGAMAASSVLVVLNALRLRRVT
jgi:Cu+-exporting ATPase